MLYLTPFLSALTLTVGIQVLFLFSPFFRRPLFHRRERRERAQAPLRLGGAAMIAGFTLAVIMDPHLVITPEIFGVLLGAGLILLFGLWDDFSDIAWRTQLAFQVILAVLVFLFGVRILTITNPWGGVWIFPPDGFHLLAFLLLLVWLILVINSMNWLDGLDGLAGGVALICLAAIFFLSLKPEVNQPPLALIAATGMGAVLGFLFFNIHPARIVAGTSGSVFLGFLIAILAVLGGTKIATALLVLALPVADALHVLYRRYRAGHSLFLPDRRHFHYRLEELGWKESRIAFLFASVTACIAVVALTTQALGKLTAILLSLGVIFAFLLFVEYRIEHRKP